MPEPFDDTAKAFYRRLFVRWGLPVSTQQEVFARGRAIDIVAWCEELAARARVQGTVFSHFRRLNALEFKGPEDPLDLDDYNLIMMRAWGLGSLKLREPSTEETAADDPAEARGVPLPGERTVTIVCVTRPDRILDDLREELRFFPTEEPGVYRCDERMSQWIIHPTELELAPRNYPLLPLARGEKLRQFIELCVCEGLTDYLQLVLDVGLTTDPAVVWQKILEVVQMRAVLPEETYRDIDEFLRLTPEVQEKLPWAREIAEEAERRGDEKGRRRGEEEGRRRGEETGRVRAQQQTLLRFLQRRFGDPPPGTVRRIEATQDTEQLDAWLDRVIDAASLADMGITDEGEAQAP